jgi:phosphoribosylamine--glycine ligase
MDVLLVGHGGREASLAWRLTQCESLGTLYVAGKNPGWPPAAQLREAAGVDAVVDVARHLSVGLVVVGPEAPLAQGLADRLDAVGIPCFGPGRAAARLEASKSFAKEVMAAVGVPTAEALVVEVGTPEGREAARARCQQGAVVLKADGLAAGKGVFVCPSAEEALEALETITSGRFGDAADRLVLEDLLIGPEVSVFGLSDGERVVALPSAQDHKRLGDGGRGPNTGGMGAYAPCPLVSLEEAQRLVEAVHAPVVREMAERGAPFRGVLFAGLMLTKDGPQVLEFNVRFGDPECQALMCLWDEDILPWLYGCAAGRLPSGNPSFRSGAACCVVLASEGYPLKSITGREISEGAHPEGLEVFHAGTTRDQEGVLRTAGGRVLGLTGVADTIEGARSAAYAGADIYGFDGCQMRTDIALRTD